MRGKQLLKQTAAAILFRQQLSLKMFLTWVLLPRWRTGEALTGSFMSF